MKKQAARRVLLGGIGGDSHSVGLHILRRALAAHGYDVVFLGIQNEIDDFLERAGEFDAVMVSNMDGHARQYLKDFAARLLAMEHPRPLWYLGGNLTIGEPEDCQKELERLGFDRVFVKFVDLASVLEMLAADLRAARPAPRRRAAGGPAAGHRFARQREEVLAGWPTGAAARSLADNAKFLGAQPRVADVLADVHAGRRPMVVQPRSGVPDLEQQIGLFRQFGEQGAAVVSYQVDSLTRNNNYRGAAEAIATSERRGAAVLNGFPAVNHGVPGLRRVVSAVGLPVQTRHSTRDPRLLAEISYAGGVSAFEGGPICYDIPYYKDYPLREAIARWRYVDRLTAWYAAEHGIVLDREYFGTLTATLIPPAIAIVTDLLEAALAAEQGVRCVSLAYAEQGNRAQDIAAIRTLQQLGPEILGGLGHRGLEIHTVFHQYMAAFPPSRRRSEELIVSSALTAALAGATRIITKTPAESRKIPTVADNLRGLDLARHGLALAAAVAGGQGGSDAARLEEAVQREMEQLRREVLAIFRGVEACGRGDLGAGIVEAFDRGLLDVPFAPSIHNRGRVLTARDVSGAVRFLDTGDLPFDRQTRDLHRQLMADRRRAEGLASRRDDYLLIERDVLQIAREQHAGWPLDAPDVGLSLPPRKPLQAIA
jgi:methylaspartate mutase epsilon subunit